MISLKRYGLLALVCGLLAACGGGGGSSSAAKFSISLSPSALTFSGIEGDGATAAQVVTVNFEGDGLLVGYPPGQPDPGWLVVNRASTANNASPQKFNIQANSSALSAGSYTATLRFVTGSADGNNVKTADVAVRFNLAARATASPNSLQRQIMEGGSLPPDTVSIDPKGHLQKVASAPDWVRPVLTNNADGTQTLTVNYLVETLPPGSRIGDISLAAVDSGIPGTGVSQFLDISTAFLTVSPASLIFNAVCGGPLPASAPLQLGSTAPKHLDFSAVASSTNAAGSILAPVANGTTDASVPVAPATTNLAPGVYRTDLRFDRRDTGESRDSPVVAVRYDISAPVLSVSDPAPQFEVNAATTAADLGKTLTFGDNGSPLNWALVGIAPPWLTVNAAGGDTRSNRQLTLKIDQTKLAAMENGDYSADLSIRGSVPNGSACGPDQFITVAVRFKLALPTIEGVMPLAAVVGTGQLHAVGGTGFKGGSSLQLNIGGQPVAVQEAPSDQVLRFTAPNLAAGVYAVTIDNALGITRRAGQLRYVTALAAQRRQTIAHAGYRSLHAAYDAGRNRVYSLEYVADPGKPADRGLFVYVADNSGTWSRSKMVARADLNDFDLAADGSKLWLVADRLYSLDLANASAPLVEAFRLPADSSSSLIQGVRALVNGELLLATGGGSEEVIRYQPRTAVINIRYRGLFCPSAAAPADGSLGFVLSNGCVSGGGTNYGYRVYRPGAEALEDSRTAISGSDFYPDRRGKRAFYNTNFFDTSSHSPLTVVDYAYSAAFAPSERKLWLARADFSSSTAKYLLDTYDVTAAPVAGNYPAPVREDLTVDGVGIPFQLTVTPDGGTLFVLGNDGFLVLPR